MAGIFKNSNLEVGFERLEQDIIQRGRSRLLSQFYKSEVLKQLLDCVSEEVQILYDELWKTLKGRTLGNGEDNELKAEGEQLNIIGDIVGAKKILYNYGEVLWFAPDNPTTPNSEVRKTDGYPVWTLNAPIGENIEAPDNVWRQIILAKIFKNHCKYASAPEIRYFVSLLTDINISFMKIGPDEIQMVADQNSNISDLRWISTIFRNTEISSFYLLPLPPDVNLHENTVLIVEYNENNEMCSFAPDRDPYGKTDFSRVTMQITI